MGYRDFYKPFLEENGAYGTGEEASNFCVGPDFPFLFLDTLVLGTVVSNRGDSPGKMTIKSGKFGSNITHMRE